MSPTRPAADARDQMLRALNASAPVHGSVRHAGSTRFGAALNIERFVLDNDLEVLLCEDHSAPVVAYHTWFRVGSRHEREGKTGLAHLFEHLMFNEVEGLPAGGFDRKLEEAGADNNACTWFDWTQYTISVPRSQLDLVVGLEADRMGKLVLREPQVKSEKEVVANERRYRVEDDVEGAVSELLWSTAFTAHAYRWPTIGWMDDILGFTTEDCAEFYRTFYAPNNATVVVVGDVTEAELLGMVSPAYGHLPASDLPMEDFRPEPPQTGERTVEVNKPTATEKLLLGYHGPALGDFDHLGATLLSEVLFGGRASRMQQKLVRELEIASEVRAFVGPFRDPGLIEVYAAARGEHRAEALLAAIDEQMDRVLTRPVAQSEIDRARARLELGLLASLETADGKASNIGFYNAVLGRPGAAFERLQTMRRLDANDLRRAARRFLSPEQRSVVRVRADARRDEEANA